ncbi:sugar porter family MFS transporter [Propionibacterium freudenreichii]|nr:sugar porter family MFS transporter [Propionibacterium freudenreichii]
MSTNNQLDIRLDMPRAELDAAVAKVPAGGKHRSIGLIALVATLGSFLFGYDTGVISGALPYMYMPFGAHGLEITASEEGWIGGTLLVGAAVGALIGGRLSDRYGRRHNILLLAFIFAIGAIGTALAPNIWVMYPMRFVLGFAVGGASATVPVYLSETAPKRIRGRIVAIDQVMIVTGQLLAFTFNALIDNAVGGPQLDVAGNTQGHLQTGTQTWDNVLALQTSQGGPFDPAAWHSFVNALLVDGGNGMAWRVMLMLCTIPAIALWIGMRFMPESPRWYAANRRYYESIGALKQVRDPHRDGAPADEFDEMLVSHRREEGQKKGTFGDIWRTPWLRKLFLVGVFLAICNQTTGVNTVMYYAPKVLQYAGMGTSASITAQTANGIMSVIGCSVALWLIGRFRRRQILITCLFSVFVTLGVIALLFEVTIAPAITEGGRPPSWAPMVILAMMGLFMLVVQAGNGPVVWTMLGEMFPSKVRGIANGTAVFCMWMVNALITATFPTMMEGLGGGITYGIYAVINLVFAFILIKIMPETSNKSLEEIEVYAEARYS